MTANRYFVHDLESDKLHIFTGGKADWLTIPEADRDQIKRACLWSGSRGCWVSRALAHRFWARDVLLRNGFEDRGTTGAKLTFAEKVEAREQRAEERADRMADRADRARAEADGRFGAAHAIADVIPLGQPILVGHHSEARHRRDLAKIDNHMRAGVEAMDRAKHYQQRAAAARETAEGKQYRDPGFLGRRISEQEAEERLLRRRLDGEGRLDPTQPISEEYRARLTELLEDCRDKLGFYRACFELARAEREAAGKKVWDRESLKGKKEVLTRWGWQAIVRLNPKTVAVPNTCFPTEELQRKWAMKVPYPEVRDAR
jgi:hypothetical protein